MGWIVLGHQSQLWHSSKEGHWILSWKFRHETTLVDCLVSYACNTLVRAMLMVLAQSQLSISSEWFGNHSVLCTTRHHVENPTITNIIFKILHVSLDKKGLFSVIALRPEKLLPDVPHSYYIEACWKRENPTFLHSTTAMWKMEARRCCASLQNDSLFLASLLSHRLECEK